MERHEDHEPPVDFDGSPEAIFVRTVEGLQATHREVLENIVLYAKHKQGTGDVGRELLTQSGRRLVEEFRMCVDLIDEIEPDPAERRELLAWLFLDEQARRLNFINFYSGMTGFTLTPRSQEKIMDAIDRMQEAGETDAAAVHFHHVINGDALRFVSAYRAHQA